MNGNITGKGFSSFQVNEALLTKVVEAIKKGEAEARRYSQVRSFEIYYNGFRSRMVFGRIMVVPAKIADSVEDFPSALLYGAMVKEISPEAQADLYTYKLGESEFDEYEKKDLTAIKERLFKDADGVFRSVVVFVPTWANVRDFVIFKFTRDTDRLLNMVRHQIYGAYFNPAFSSAFDHLANDTDNLNVSEITPKLNYPGMEQGAAGEAQVPNLQPGDAEVKPGKAPEAQFPILERGDGEGKTASTHKPIRLFAADTAQEIAEEKLEPEEKSVMAALADAFDAKLGGSQTSKEAAKPEDYERTVMLPHSRGYGEYYRCSDCQSRFITPEALKGHEPVCPGPGHVNQYEEQAKERAAKQWKSDLNGATVAASTDDTGAETGLRRQPDYNEKDSHCNEANALAEKDAKAASAKDKESPKVAAVPVPAPQPVLTIQGHKLFQTGTKFAAVAAGGHKEDLRINGIKVKWARPNQFTSAFRRGVELYLRNPKNYKQANVPLETEEILDTVMRDFGAPPSVDVPESGQSESSAPAEHREEPKQEAPKTEEQPEESTEEEKKPWEKSAAIKSDALGKCASCQKDVLASEGSEIAPDTFMHNACQEKIKEAAFNMYIPGQVLQEFYPGMLHNQVDGPSENFGGSEHVSLDGLPLGGDKYISTDPTAAMGIGRDGKPQVLEGAPLRQENDIRGYQFDQEYYAAQQNLPSRVFASAYSVERINKKANVEEFKAQFADFLKKAMGEVAASFIAAFRVTFRPPMNKVPGTGELRLDALEANANPSPSMGVMNGTAVPVTNIASRVRYLISKLTDSQIQEAINGAWAKSDVYNEAENGGFTYEVFVRPEALDKDTLVLSYSFVVGTKGL